MSWRPISMQYRITEVRIDGTPTDVEDPAFDGALPSQVTYDAWPESGLDDDHLVMAVDMVPISRRGAPSVGKIMPARVGQLCWIRANGTDITLDVNEVPYGKVCVPA